MLIETDEGLANLLATVRHVALVGASHKPERPSYQVLEFLLKKGYRVTPVNPALAGQILQGQTVVGALSDIDDPVDLIDIFRDGNALPGLVDEAIAMGAPSLWTQLPRPFICHTQLLQQRRFCQLAQPHHYRI